MSAQASSLYDKYGVRPLRLPRTATTAIQIRSIPGKGRGLFLNRARDVPAGTVLFHEHALVYRFPDNLTDDEPREVTNQRLETVLRALSIENQQKFVQLSSKGLDDEFDRVNTNSFSDKVNPTDKYAPETSSTWWLGSFFNHSCIANCDIIFDNGRMTVKTVLPVSVGTELTISYLAHQDLAKSAAQRNRHLQGWGFSCNCDACQSKDQRIHNINRDKIRQLCTKLYFKSQFLILLNNPILDDASRQDAEELITLAHAVHLRYLLANAHTRAIEAWSMCNDDQGDTKMKYHQAELISERKIYEGIADPELNGLQLGSQALAEAKDVAAMRTICEHTLAESRKRSSEDSEGAGPRRRKRSKST
jgi:SET domain